MSQIAALALLDAQIRPSVVSPLTGIRALLAAARARHQARRSYIHLLEVDPHMLRDIGVTREEVRQALRALDR